MASCGSAAAASRTSATWCAPFPPRTLRALLDDAGVPWLGAIAQRRLRTPAHLHAHLREVVAGGGEGLVLHRANARYRAGRSDQLRKLKPWRDAEARVVGYRPGKGKYAGQVGALVVEDASGRRFALGSGLDDADRRHPPAKGTLVTYRYNGLTGKGTPRFARFLRVRTE
jgi:DNA ligase-1